MQDIVAAARLRAASNGQPTPKGPVSDFVVKLRAAWRIFFPPRAADLTPKEEGKQRLRMILVADRCGMNQSSLFEMKHSIVQVVSEFVEIEAEELVDVNISSDSAVGTIYTVNVPVRRVKPKARVPLTEDGSADIDGISMEWDNEDPEADPTERFPYGC
jgi:cell division topological specificity factor MinE